MKKHSQVEITQKIKFLNPQRESNSWPSRYCLNTILLINFRYCYSCEFTNNFGEGSWSHLHLSLSHLVKNMVPLRTNQIQEYNVSIEYNVSSMRWSTDWCFGAHGYKKIKCSLNLASLHFYRIAISQNVLVFYPVAILQKE